MSKPSPKPEVVVGRIYYNRIGDRVQIDTALKEGDPGYDQGYRFRDTGRNTYLPDGRWSATVKKTDRDLIVEHP